MTLSKLSEKMRVKPIALIALAAATLFWPASALAKRSAPKPVPPVVWQGVEYRAPLDVAHMGHVQAFELSSGRKLWETKVYDVRIIPLLEEDVQWVFISAMNVQDGKLLVRNEGGKSFRLDLSNGGVEGAVSNWVLWLIAGGLLLVLAFLVWLRVPHGQKGVVTNGGHAKSDIDLESADKAHHR